MRLNMKYKYLLLLGCMLCSLGSKAFEYKIPFTLYENKILIEVVIEKKKYNFVFDSGAMSLLDKDMVNMKKAKNVAIDLEAEDANEQKKKLSVIQVPSLKLENINFKDGYFAVHDFTAINERSCVPIAGIFGSNLMNNLVWKIDFKEKMILVTDQSVATGGALEITFEKEAFSNVPYTKLNVRGAVIDLVLDTGSGDALTIGKNAFDKIKDSTFLEGTGPSATSLFGNNEGTFYEDSVAISFPAAPGKVFKGVHTTAQGNEMALLGIDFLKHYAPVFDYKVNKLFLNTDTVPVSESLMSWGFGLAGIEGKLIVINMFNIPELQALFKVGEQIIAVNDINTEKPNKLELCRVMELRKQKDTLVLTKTDGTKVTVSKMNLQTYF
ncbi:MAG: hypothetical protein EOP54_07810 [Sphingobacteriales bacterium]|nr:MAG: hypothetical protein EOP54_07810 [Sphingobacteriales bacterium]